MKSVGNLHQNIRMLKISICAVANFFLLLFIFISFFANRSDVGVLYIHQKK